MKPDEETAFATALYSHDRPEKFQADEHVHEYFQTSLLSAIMQGVYDGMLTVRELLAHGNFGLGTFHALDGEMIVLDGVAYRFDEHGNASVPSQDATTPYAAVIDFEPTVSFRLTEATEKTQFEAELDSMAEARNLFYAVRFKGVIKSIKYRSTARQSKPYKPLLEVVKTQAEFEKSNIRGTVLGFRCPDYAVGIGVPGYHFHFISDDRATGGHVLDYCLGDGTVEIDHTSSLHLELPETQAFSNADLS